MLSKKWNICKQFYENFSKDICLSICTKILGISNFQLMIIHQSWICQTKNKNVDIQNQRVFHSFIFISFSSSIYFLKILKFKYAINICVPKVLILPQRIIYPDVNRSKIHPSFKNMKIIENKFQKLFFILF